MGMPRDNDYRLLTALAEDLKLPLVQIARQSELDGLPLQQRRAEMAMRLIDGYVLGLQTEGQQMLELEPVTLASILHDTAEELAPFARQQGYDIRVSIAGKFGPVMGDRRLLKNAFAIVGYELLQIPAEAGHPTLTLASHRSKSGVVAGVFSNNAGISADAFRRAKAMVGTARRTLPSGPVSNGAGLFIADSLLKGIGGAFKLARHDKQTGLAATFVPSRQLQLV